MLRKIFNSLLASIFIILVLLFAYQIFNKPNIVTAYLQGDSTHAMNGSTKDANSSTSSIAKQELHAIIKEYIINNPEDIILSLEGLQKKKLLESGKQISDYLEKHRADIEQINSPPIFGNLNGDISIVVFYDYHCYFCKQFNDTLNELVKLDSGVKIILRPLPILSKDSTYTTNFALAIHKISPENFSLIHNDIMQMENINDEAIKALITKYKIDQSLIDNEVSSYSIKQLIKTNFEFAKHLGIKGAPSYIINGKFLSGAISIEKFKQIIEEMRNKTSK